MIGMRSIGSCALLVLPAYFLFRPEEREGIVPGSAAAALPEIPRANSSLSPEEFFRNHVRQGVPLILSLDEPTPGLEHFLSECTEKLNLLSTQQADVLRDLLDEELPMWKWLAANFLLLLTTGSTARGWAELRHATAQQLHQGPAAASYYGPPRVARLLHFLGDLFDIELLKHASVIAQLIAQPVYLADKVVDEICPALRPDAELTKYEKHVLQRLEQQQVQWQSLSVIKDIGLRHESEARIFYGGPKSYSYPMHRDLPDGDVLCVLHSGCKDVVMLQPHSRKKMSRLLMPGFEGISQFTWAYDFFSSPPLEVDGWAGTFRAGELLYMPGEMLHHIRNSCRHSFTICRRPWRATAARDVALETMKTLRLALESEEDVGHAIAALRQRRKKR